MRRADQSKNFCIWVWSSLVFTLQRREAGQSAYDTGHSKPPRRRYGTNLLGRLAPKGEANLEDASAFVYKEIQATHLDAY